MIIYLLITLIVIVSFLIGYLLMTGRKKHRRKLKFQSLNPQYTLVIGLCLLFISAVLFITELSYAFSDNLKDAITAELSAGWGIRNIAHTYVNFPKCLIAMVFMIGGGYITSVGLRVLEKKEDNKTLRTIFGIIGIISLILGLYKLFAHNLDYDYQSLEYNLIANVNGVQAYILAFISVGGNITCKLIHDIIIDQSRIDNNKDNSHHITITESSIESLNKLLHHPDIEKRIASATKLRELAENESEGDCSTIASLNAMLAEMIPRARESALQTLLSLARIGITDSSSLLPLNEMIAKESNPSVRADAHLLIAIIKARMK